MRYAHDPIAYESEEWSRPDEMALFSLLWSTVRRVLDSRPGARLLDVCCGSGMSLLGSLAHPRLAYSVGIDISHQLLDFARQRFTPFRHIAFVCADATFSPFAPSTFDIITASSAYHHMKPSQKQQFLLACRQLLKTGGRLILAENILPNYSDDGSSYDSAVVALYSAVTDEALGHYPSLPDSIRDMIAENVRLSLARQYEFKVDYEGLLQDLSDADFVVEEEHQAWKAEPVKRGSRAGNLLLVARTKVR
jgi:ubiquinone/menaquinone biosynthesis C-methylase UbiE